MACETAMYVHYVMTAKDLIEDAKKEEVRSKKCTLLFMASELLLKAEKLGVPAETLAPIRNSIIAEYIRDYQTTYSERVFYMDQF